MEEEPHHHVLLRNEVVEVIRATLPAGESTLFHTHSHDSAGVELTNDTTTEQLSGKPESPPSTTQIGDVWAESLADGRAYSHRVRNVGDGSMDLVAVVFLKGSEVPALPAASTIAAENSESRVYKWVLAPGATCPMHAHLRPYIFVAATSVQLATSAPGEKSFAEDFKPGDFRWVSSRITHAFTNEGSTEGQIVEIELK
jgi:quercetin dioxygenase-like cupin family protein